MTLNLKNGARIVGEYELTFFYKKIYVPVDLTNLFNVKLPVYCFLSNLMVFCKREGERVGERD